MASNGSNIILVWQLICILSESTGEAHIYST